MFIPYKIEEEHEFERYPYLVYVICVLCAIVHVVLYRFCSEFQRDNIFYEFGCVPSDFRWWSPVTCMFLHGSFMHLAGNLYFFWIYGRTCEKAMGAVKFLLLYLIGGVVSVMAHVWTVSWFAGDEPTIGASGAISAVLGAFLVIFPNYKIRFLVICPIYSRPLPTHAPAYFVLGAWFLLQIFDTLQLGGEVAGVAFWAHIAGFAAGAVIGSIYLALDRWSCKRYEAGCRAALRQAAETWLAGGDPLPELEAIPEYEWNMLRDDGVLDDTVVRALAEHDPEHAFDRLYREFLEARNRKDAARTVFYYFRLILYYGPERLNYDTHYCAAALAASIDCRNIAFYAYYHAVHGRSGSLQGMDRLLAGLTAMLERAGLRERAEAAAAVLAEFFPHSPLVRRDLLPRSEPG